MELCYFGHDNTIHSPVAQIVEASIDNWQQKSSADFVAAAFCPARDTLRSVHSFGVYVHLVIFWATESGIAPGLPR